MGPIYLLIIEPPGLAGHCARVAPVALPVPVLNPPLTEGFQELDRKHGPDSEPSGQQVTGPAASPMSGHVTTAT